MAEYRSLKTTNKNSGGSNSKSTCALSRKLGEDPIQNVRTHKGGGLTFRRHLKENFFAKSSRLQGGVKTEQKNAKSGKWSGRVRPYRAPPHFHRLADSGDLKSRPKKKKTRGNSNKAAKKVFCSHPRKGRPEFASESFYKAVPKGRQLKI